MTAPQPGAEHRRQLIEAIRLRSGELGATEANSRAIELVTQVQIPTPEAQLRKYPHQLSGGMLQRVLIAIALAGQPRLLIADEPTSALDVTVQAGILDLLLELQERTGIAMLMITHDLGVARVVSDRIHVMKDGRFVESGEVEDIVGRPQTDYTRQLLSAVPQLGSGRRTSTTSRHRRRMRAPPTSSEQERRHEPHAERGEPGRGVSGGQECIAPSTT